MIDLSQARTKRLLAIHGWSGMLLGLFLYIVLVTGAVAVFASEIGRWSVGGTVHEAPLTTGVHQRVIDFAETVKTDHLDEIMIYPNEVGHLVFFFHKHAMNADGDPDDYGELIELNAKTNETVRRVEGFSADVFGTDPQSALDDFLIDLHITLHMPDPWGLYATGVLGFVMFLAAGTGLLIHRHLLRDIFVPPRYSSALLNKRDRHILAGSWGLPFAFVLAFTGAFLSFTGALGLPIVVKSAFGGDMMAMIGTLVGAPEAADPSPMATANLDDIISASTVRAGSAPNNITVSHWGRADAVVTLGYPEVEGDFKGQTFVYDGVSGDFMQSKPDYGLTPSAGSTALTLMSTLHFGSFAGLLSKFIWFALGFAMAYVSLSGLRLWIERRGESVLWERFDTATTVAGYGLPLALVGAAYGFFFSLNAGTSQFWTPVGCIAVGVACIGAGSLWHRSPQLRDGFAIALGAALIGTPMLRFLIIGGGWGVMGPVDEIVIMLDLIFIVGGLASLKSVSAREPLAVPSSGRVSAAAE